MIPVKLTEASSTDWSYTGIYKITNSITGKCYIGQAVDIRARLMNHVSASKKNKHVIYKAIRKYGIDNFDCRILIIINTFGKA
jgi:group I intron endonuclease